MRRNKIKTKIKVIVNLSVDIDNMSFPTDKNGVLLWSPMFCIEDLISHGLFKEHDATYMNTIDPLENIKFKDWEVQIPIDIHKKLMEIFIRNNWEHPEFKGGKDLHSKFKSLDEALKVFIESIEK